MQIRVQKRGYSSVAMLAAPVLALSLGSVTWASVCNPGCSVPGAPACGAGGALTFLELDANLGFNGLTGASFDWADSGANPSGCLTSSNQTTPIMCSGSGGIFDGGKFNTATTPPTPPTETTAAATNTTIVAASFAVDQLSVDVSNHCRFQVETLCSTNSNCQLPSASPPKFCACGDKQGQACAANGDCTGCRGISNPCQLDTCVLCDGDPTAYTGAGSETNGDLLSSDTYGKSGSLPNKDDISNVYAIAHQNPPNTDTSQCTSCSAGGDGCNVTNEIFAGFERVVNNGDSHVDLEFLQEPVSLVQDDKSNVCAGSFRGHRTEGDLLLSVDFTTGGTFADRILYRWVCGDCPKVSGTKICDPCKVSGNMTPAHYQQVAVVGEAGTNFGHCSNNPQVSCTQPTQTTDCGTGATCLLINDAIKQSINGAAVGCGGWACRHADGTGPVGTLDSNELYEVGIDLAGIGFSGCISTFLPHTRSSQSFTAVLKDFTVIPFNTCVPSTKLTKTVSPTGPIITGSSVTYSYNEQNDGNVQLSNVSITDDKCTPVNPVLGGDGVHNVGDNGTCTGCANNGKLDPGETWTFTCTRTLTKADCQTPSNNCTVTNTATSSADFTPPGTTTAKHVTFCADPNNPPVNTFCDQDERATATVSVLTPSTRMTKSASPSVVTTVVYTYTETNDGEVALTPPGGTSNPGSIVVDTQCTSHGGTIALDSGDDGNGVLDKNETWTLKCTATFTGAAAVTTISDTAVGHGCFTSGGATKDVTLGTVQSRCGASSSVFPDADETASATVNVCTP